MHTSRPRRAKGESALGASNRIPASLLEDRELNDALASLPSNYSFEIHKTVHQIRTHRITRVGLQMPEGLLLFACTIVDILQRFTDASAIILGDVTYGACCVDDFTAVALGCDMLVHYGHSCLVPIDSTRIRTLYVFVSISIDLEHLVGTVRRNIQPTKHSAISHRLASYNQGPDSASQPRLAALEIEAPTVPHDPNPNEEDSKVKLALVSTIQFTDALHFLKEQLSPNYLAVIPRSKPLSPGEILGCTAPRLPGIDSILYLGDGRFHLEAIMIANPNVAAFRYDPYAKKLTREWYDHSSMKSLRRSAIDLSRQHLSSPQAALPWGIILGTLGRQGNVKQFEALKDRAAARVPVVPILLSELSPTKLGLFGSSISVFVQTSCPRLSIDWGIAFGQPLLTPYEASVALGLCDGWWEKHWQDQYSNNSAYPMDFYENGSPWSTARNNGRLLESASGLPNKLRQA